MVLRGWEVGKPGHSVFIAITISGILKETCFTDASERSGKSQEIGENGRQLLCHVAPGGRSPPG